MKKLSLIMLTAFVISLIACGGGQVKDPNVAGSVDENAWVTSSNSTLAKYPVGGFGYKSSKMPKQNWNSWAKNAAPVVKGILNQVPGGYVLQVTGHTDASGPEEPEGAKPGNIKISTDRARTVHGALKAQGITSNKLTYKGVGSSDLISGVDERSGQQRRVTFQIVPE